MKEEEQQHIHPASLSGAPTPVPRTIGPDARVPPWQPWEAVPVALGAFVATALVSLILTAITGGIGGISYQLTVLAFPVALAAFTVLWVSIRYRAVVDLRLGSTRPRTDVVLGALFGAGLFAATTLGVFPVVRLLWELVAGNPPSPITQPVVPADPGPAQLVVGVIAVIAAAPIGEELFFRGMIFGSLRSRFGFWVAGAISSAVFAIVHVQPPLVILMFFVGFALAFIYERRGSLTASIAAHAAFNLIGFTLILLVR
jgi:membrane protease YdiL (CAAX protease family)